MNKKQSLGRWGEALAAGYLEQKGYTIVDSNVRTPFGEIDLVMRQGDSTVFVEVKTRSSQAFGFPEEAITERKRVHLIESSQYYLQAHPNLEGDWRIDVIAIQKLSHTEQPAVVHFENAIS